MTVSVNLVTDFGAVGDGVTSCVTAFNSFKTFGRLHTDEVILTVPAGTYLIDDLTNFNPWFCDGVRNLTINGYGATIKNCQFGAMQGSYDDNLHSARIATVAAGANSVRLLTPAQASIFSVGDWAYIGALDLQGYGSPPNHHFFEFQQISAIQGDQIYFTGSLANDYAATYPVYSTGDGFHPDQGGPATIYRTHPYWNCVNGVYGLTVDSSMQTYFKGQACYFQDCTFVGPGIAPTFTRSHRERACLIGGQTEVDKAVQYVEFDNCEFNSTFITQSSSVDEMVLTDCTFNSDVNGTAKRVTITNCTMPSLRIRPISYGAAYSAHLEDCTIDAFAIAGFANHIAEFVIANGTLRKPLADGTVQWAVPGGYGIFGTEALPEVFRISDVRGDGTYLYIDTTLPEPIVIPPSAFGISGFGTATPWIGSYGGLGVTAVNCTGCVEVEELSLKASDASANSYAFRTLTGDFGIDSALYPSPITSYGNLVTLKINVVRAYTGIQSSLKLRTAQFHQIYAVKADNTAQGDFGAEVNLKIAGQRIIAPTGNSGAQTGDILPTVPATGLWFPSQVFVPWQSASIAAEAESTWPIIEFELTFDHAVPVEEVEEIVPPPSTGGVSPVDPKLLKKYRKELEKRIKDRDRRKAQEAQEEEDNRNALIAAYEAQLESERQAAEAAARAKEARRNTVTDLDRIMHALELDY